MTRWLIVPVLCALAMPSTASAGAPASPPAAEGATAGAPAAVASPAEGSKAARAAEATEVAAAAAPTENEAPEAAAPPTSDAIQPAAPDVTAAAPTVAPPAPTPPPLMVITTVAPPTGPQRHKSATPLLATGLTGFASVYLLTAYTGAATIDKARRLSRGYDDYRSAEPDRDGKMTRNRGRALLIPVAGPFIAMHFTNSAQRKYWQAVNGGLQAGTLAMAIIGTRLYAKHRRAKRRAQVTASASPQGAQVGMSMRF